MKRIVCLILSLMLATCMTMSCLAESSAPQGGIDEQRENPPAGMDEPPQGGPGGDRGNPPDGMGGPGGMAEGDVASTGNATNANGTIDVTDGIVTADESLAGSVEETDGTITISRVSYESGDYSDTLLSASNSDVTLTGANITMNVIETVSGNESAGTAAYVDSGTLTISDSNINGIIDAETIETLDDGTTIYTNATVKTA